MEVAVKETKKSGKCLELIANTEEDVKNLEEMSGKTIEKFDDNCVKGRILAILIVPFSTFK